MHSIVKFKVTEIKPIYGFRTVFKVTMYLLCTVFIWPLEDVHSHLTLTICVKVKFNVTKIKPIYDFLLVFNSIRNYVPNMHCFQVMATRKCTYSHLTLKISLKVKFKVTKMKPIYNFLFVSNSNYVPNLHRFSYYGY